MEQVEAAFQALVNPLDDDAALEVVMPLIVPASYFNLSFPAPHEALPTPDFVLTAVLPRDNKSMVYVDKELAERWASQGIHWRDRAMDNLRAADDGQPITHGKTREDGSFVLGIMMTPDGIGTSRVYRSDILHEMFPEGYWVAIPERSVGMVIPKNLTDQEFAEVKEMVEHCYKIGTIPNSPKIYDPEELGA